MMFLILRHSFHHIDMWDMSKNEGDEWIEEAIILCIIYILAIPVHMHGIAVQHSWKQTTDRTRGMTKIRIVQNASGTMERQDFPNIVGMSAKCHSSFIGIV